MIDDDSEVAEGSGHDPDILDLRHVREAASLTGECRRGEHLQGGVLRAADRDLAGERDATIDPEDLAGHGLGRVFPIERLGVSHASQSRAGV